MFEDKVQRSLGNLEQADTWAFRTRQRILDALKGEAPSVERVASGTGGQRAEIAATSVG